MADEFHRLRAMACDLHAQAEHLDAKAARLRGDVSQAHAYLLRASQQEGFRRVHQAAADLDEKQPR